jgi:hypothetical protein
VLWVGLDNGFDVQQILGRLGTRGGMAVCMSMWVWAICMHAPSPDRTSRYGYVHEYVVVMNMHT